MVPGYGADPQSALSQASVRLGKHHASHQRYNAVTSASSWQAVGRILKGQDVNVAVYEFRVEAHLLNGS